MIIITGAAGFIGSALLWGLNQKGVADVLLVDEIDHPEKEHNLGPLHYEELVGITEFRKKLEAGDYDRSDVRAILHMGANSSTTETNWARLKDNNVEYSKNIIRWCVDHGVRCVYASSGATYGDGSKGYSDDHALFGELAPLNLYGKSKLLVDIWARDGGYLEQVAGVRYFNVFGPNEYHKESMASVPFKKFHNLQTEGVIELFSSNHPDYLDGEQRRDFIYIKDVIRATLWLLEKHETAGIFNVGSGQARSWNEVAKAMFGALRPAQGKGRKTDIRYIPMPNNLQKQYQNFTQSDIGKLRAAGYKEPMMGLEEAVHDYIRHYLLPHKHLGEV